MKRFLLGVLGFTFMACHGGGADPGPGGKLTAMTVCTDIGMALCDKIDGCGPTPPGGGNCFDTFMGACCTGAGCTQQTNDTQQEVNACASDITHESCADAANGVVPTSCANL